MCQPGRPRPQGESHHVSSPGLLPFQSAKSSGSRLCSPGSADPAPSSSWSMRWLLEHPVAVEAAHREVDVAAGLVGVPARDQLLDQRDDLGHRLGRQRLAVGPAQAQQLGVGDVGLDISRASGSDGTPWRAAAT